MGLPTNDKNKNKKGGNQKNNSQGNSKFLPKANTKGAGPAKRLLALFSCRVFRQPYAAVGLERLLYWP